MRTIPRHTRSLRLPHSPARVALLLLTLLAVVPVANGQGVDAYVRWSAEAIETDAEPGINLQLALRADITDGWKMYAMDSPRPSRGVDITVTGAPADVKVVGSVRQADPRHAFDPNFQIDVTYFVGTADFFFDLDVAPEVDRSRAVLGVDVLFQICNDALGICLPPTTRATEHQTRWFAGACGRLPGR